MQLSDGHFRCFAKMIGHLQLSDVLAHTEHSNPFLVVFLAFTFMQCFENLYIYYTNNYNVISQYTVVSSSKVACMKKIPFRI